MGCSVAWIQLDGVLEPPFSFPPVQVTTPMPAGQRDMGFGQRLLQLDGLSGRLGRQQTALLLRYASLLSQPHVCVGQSRVGGGVTRVQIQGLPETLDSLV